MITCLVAGKQIYETGLASATHTTEVLLQRNASTHSKNLVFWS